MQRLALPHLLATFTLTVLCAAMAHAAEPFDPRLSVSLGYHFSSGKYGTADTTEIGYVPLVLKAQSGRWIVQTTLPYLRVSGPAGLLQGPTGVVRGVGGEADGLGDILGRVSYTLPPKADWLPYVEFIGRIKFPSASRAQGLGTGEFDYGAEAELSWTVGRFTPFVGGGYRFLGSPPGTTLSDVFVGSVGGMYSIFASLSGGIFLDYRESPAPTVGERLDLIPFVSWKIDPAWAVDTYASAGLANGSADGGVGMQLSYSLPAHLFTRRAD